MGAVESRGSRTPLPESLRRLRTLLSPYTGIVREAFDLLYAPDDARLFSVACETAEGLTTGGVHHEREGALAAALGEAAERSSAGYVPESALVLATADELGPEAVDPARFALFREDQYAEPDFPYRPFARDTPVRWVRGFSIPEGEPTYLPAQLVYLACAPARDDVSIGYATSNGTACAATLEEAILSGLLEVVERDAFALTWYRRLALPRLDWHAEPALVDFERRYFAPAGLRYEVVDLTSFWSVPTALGIVHGRSPDLAALAVGAASAVTIQEAWRKALGEAFSVRSWARLLRLRAPGRMFRADFADIERFEDHVLFYAHHENAPHAAFLDSSEEVRDMREVSSLPGTRVHDWTNAVVERLRAQGAGAYAVDITAPDIREAGLRVAKVVAPELCPLDVPYRASYLGAPRLHGAGSPPELNPFPHPFP